MGILNITPDSFYDGGHHFDPQKAKERALVMINEGATIIDIGGQSSRPGAERLSPAEELKRVIPVITELVALEEDIVISIDTFNASVAEEAIAAGARIINDISAGLLDKEMLSVVARSQVPYICMHMQGEPAHMQDSPDYENVIYEVALFFSERIKQLREHQVIDIILDPGFGFGKTVKHNYQLLDRLDHFGMFSCPILAGVSRKSMIYKPLNTVADQALNGTSALHMIALERGASILRVHDVKEAMECIALHDSLKQSRTP